MKEIQVSDISQSRNNGSEIFFWKISFWSGSFSGILFPVGLEDSLIQEIIRASAQDCSPMAALFLGTVEEFFEDYLIQELFRVEYLDFKLVGYEDGSDLEAPGHSQASIDLRLPQWLSNWSHLFEVSVEKIFYQKQLDEVLAALQLLTTERKLVYINYNSDRD